MGSRGPARMPAAMSVLLAAIVLACSANAWADPGPSLSVDASAGRHAISPFIYGWNFAPADLAAAISLPVDRRGGNAADSINWKTGVEDHSNDYYFENLATCWSTCPGGWDPSLAYTEQIDRDRTAGAKSLIDLPMLGIVPKSFPDNTTAVHCSYSVAKYGAQTDVDQYDTDCGNGLKNPGGAPVANNPADTGVAVGPSYQGDWVHDLVSRYGQAAVGGVEFYELGNEPGLWAETHRDWHPQPTSADELLNDMLGLAKQVKANDPTAKVIGPAEWGWPNYFCSPKDGGCGPGGPNPVVAGSDWAKYGPVLPWILSKFKEYDDANGQRLLDYLDVHYYRQDNGNAGFDASRSLWDPTYTDQSWINDQIRLLPRMHEWVDQNYPGTKLSLSEYDLSWSNATDDNLIEADALGIFAREQLDLATLWPETANDHYEDAFRLYRNYDGKHSRFGDTYVSSQSGDQGRLAIYGAQRSGDGALTLAVINKTGSDLTSSVQLAGFAPGSAAQVWRFTGTGTGINRADDAPVSGSAISASFPAHSMSMLVVPPAGAAQQPGTTGTPGGGGSTPPGSQPAAGAKCRVPKLRGLTLAKAKAKLRKARCSTGKVTRKKSRARKGRVIAQTPKAGAVRRRGTRVALVLSRGR